MSADLDALMDVLDETLVLLTLPENNFYLAHWSNAAEAKAEILGYQRELQAGSLAHLFQLKLLYAAGGPLQEVSLSSGWGDLFFDLAYRFEAALSNSTG